MSDDRQPADCGARARRCLPPSEAGLAGIIPGADYSDAFAAPLRRTDASMAELYAGVFQRPPRVVTSMISLRNILAAPLGIRAATIRQRATIDPGRPYAVGDMIGIWRLYGLAADEIMAGADDKHLDFRVSLMKRPAPSGASLVLTTAVKTHNRLGRVYLRVILPFHRLFVRMMLDDALKSGRI